MRRFVFLLCLLIASNEALFASPTPSFEMLCGRTTHETKRAWRSLSAQDRDDLARFSAIFSEHFPKFAERKEKTGRIPHIIHFIWLGPKPFPETSIQNLRSWKKWHPDWKICFWTDSTLRDVPLDGMEKHLIDEIDMDHLRPYLARTSNFGEQSDLVRYALLWQQGGIYVDHDVECMQPFDLFTETCDFFASLCPPRQFAGIQTRIHLANCLIGARKWHPIMMASMEHAKRRWDAVEAEFSGNDTGTRIARVINRTFHSFTLATKEEMGRGGNLDIVLPVAMVPTHDAIAPAMLVQFQAQDLVFARHLMALTWAH